jgi:hypothetical protein
MALNRSAQFDLFFEGAAKKADLISTFDEAAIGNDALASGKNELLLNIVIAKLSRQGSRHVRRQFRFISFYFDCLFRLCAFEVPANAGHPLRFFRSAGGAAILLLDFDFASARWMRALYDFVCGHC